MYHRYENGQVPKDHNLQVIADRCGVTVDWLLGRGDDASTSLTRETRGGSCLACETAPGAADELMSLTRETHRQAVREHGAAYGVAERLAEVEARLATIERLLLRVLAENE